MKIYSVAWGWTPIPEDMPSGDSLLRIADSVKMLGFDGIDFLSTYESLDAYFDKTHCYELYAYCDALGLSVGGLVFQSALWNNPDPSVHKKQLEYFEKCAKAASVLGTNVISCITPAPHGASPTRSNASPSEKIATNLPPDYCWQEDWDRFATMLARACDIAALYDLKIALECFPGSICSTPHAMLALCEQIKRDNFGIQLDTAHLINQRIDVETAIYMLGGQRIVNVHFKDSDGLTRGNLPAGSGIADYTAILKALKYVGYTSNISIEVEFTDNPKRYMKQALDHTQLCVQGQY
jgi:sugar phosphate isomerase/epimerase